MPAAIIGSKPKRTLSVQPTNGMIAYWQRMPTKTAHGMARTREKSATLSVVPIPNMMIWMRGTMRAFVSNVPQRTNSCGQVIDTATVARTASVKPKP